MPHVQVRDVPDEVHQVLVRRAEAAGQSLQQYLAIQLAAFASTPTVDEVLDRIEHRDKGKLSAQDKREIWLIETHIHSYLGVLPFMMGSFVICLNWNHFQSLFGFGSEPARFEFLWKQPQLSVWYHVVMNTLLTFLLVIPYAEEAWRCYRAQRLPRLHPVIPQPANS